MIVRERASGYLIGHLSVEPLIQLFTERAAMYAIPDDPTNRGHGHLARILAGHDAPDSALEPHRRFIQRVLREDAAGNPAPDTQWVHIDRADHICHALNAMPHSIWPEYLAVSDEWAEYRLANTCKQGHDLLTRGSFYLDGGRRRCAVCRRSYMKDKMRTRRAHQLSLLEAS